FTIFPRIRFNALSSFFGSGEPRNIIFASAAMKKKFHPALWILRSRVKVSQDLTIRQLPENDSVPSCITWDNGGISSIRIVPTCMDCGMHSPENYVLFEFVSGARF